jgi:hypothetical protein
MTEVMEDGEWNMQYFGTAEGSCCIAIHQMLLQTDTDWIEIFPALPDVWEKAGFDNLLADGLTVSAKWTKASGVVWTAKNIADVPLARTLRWGQQAVTLDLQAGEEKRGEWI